MFAKVKALLDALLDDLLSHREFRSVILAATVAILVRLSAKLPVGVTVDEAREVAGVILSSLLLFLGHQGLANVGKHAQEIKSETLIAQSTMPLVTLGPDVALGPDAKTPVVGTPTS